MKNKVLVIICILIVLFVVISGIFFIKNANNSVQNPVSNLNNSNTNDLTENKPNIDSKKIINAVETFVDNVKYVYEENAINGDAKSETYSFNALDTKNVNGKSISDINSIVSTNDLSGFESEYAKLNTAKIENGENSYVELDSYFADAPEEYKNLYSYDKEVLPVRLYLQDDTVNAFYNFNGTTYYIPVEKVNDLNDERIVYQNGLTIHKNTGNVSINGKKIKMNYAADSGDELAEELEILFNSYYSKNDEVADNYKVYATNVDGKELDQFVVVLFDKQKENDTNTQLSKVLFTIDENNNRVSKTLIPYDLFGNINGYNNVFYYTKQLAKLGITAVSEDYIPVLYYIYKDSHFELVNRFLTGDSVTKPSNDLYEKEFKTKQDFPYVGYEIDGIYNLDENGNAVSGDSFIEYKLLNTNINPEEHSVLPKGTKFKIIKMLDTNGNAIIKTESGDTFIISDN